jgi:hypothetical protein
MLYQGNASFGACHPWCRAARRQIVNGRGPKSEIRGKKCSFENDDCGQRESPNQR